VLGAERGRERDGEEIKSEREKKRKSEQKGKISAGEREEEER
jgi:hypothetical protein